MAEISDNKKELVKKLYYEKQMSMREIAEHLGVPNGAVVYFMRKLGIKRRSASEANNCTFNKKKPSFQVRKNLNEKQKELQAIGAMLYWTEGYKTEKSTAIDFANSDPAMIGMFLKFLRSVYVLDESRLRAKVYCYADQDSKKMQRFWSKQTNVPLSQFTKPYVRKDFKEGGKKLAYGVLHIIYSDKKLLFEVKSLIESYTHKYRVGGRAVKCIGL